MIGKIKFDINQLKKPQSWAVIIPVVLIIWALGATLGMMDRSAYADTQVASARKTQQVALEIMTRLRQTGGDLSQNQLQYFDLVVSARQCAEAALIPISKLSQGDSSSGKTRKDGSIQHNQNYQLNSDRVKLVKDINKFDYNSHTRYERLV